MNIDGAVCLKHSSGCGMNTTGYGMNTFNRTIEGFKVHPNFGKVYVIGYPKCFLILNHLVVLYL
jgi:altronate hydrolase